MNDNFQKEKNLGLLQSLFPKGRGDWSPKLLQSDRVREF